MTKDYDTISQKLRNIDVGDKTETKNGFTYLSWAWAVQKLIEVEPTATWHVKEYGDNKQPYVKTDNGCFVTVTVSVLGVDRTQVHPVLDNRNKAIIEPNAFEVNKSIQRCLAKAISLHGLGLYIYAGEDYPETEATRRMNKEQIKSIKTLLNTIGCETIPKDIKETVGIIDAKNMTEHEASQVIDLLKKQERRSQHE